MVMLNCVPPIDHSCQVSLCVSEYAQLTESPRNPLTGSGERKCQCEQQERIITLAFYHREQSKTLMIIFELCMMCSLAEKTV